MFRRIFVTGAAFLALTVAAFGQAAQPVIPVVNGLAVSTGNPMPVSGFSVAGFTPNGNYGTLTASGSSSASTALPAGTVVVIQNSGTTEVSCVPATGAATGTISKIIVGPGGGSFAMTVGAFDHIACIDQGAPTDTTSNIVTLIGGAGIFTGTGGGGSSGGGGLSVTDSAAWTAASSAFTPSGGEYNATPATVSSGQQGTFAMSAYRYQYVDTPSSNSNLNTILTNPPNVTVNGSNAALTGLSPGTAQTGTQVNLNTDLSTVGGTTVLAGTGAVGAGSQRIAVARDTTTIAGSSSNTTGSGTISTASVTATFGTNNISGLTAATFTAGSIVVFIAGTEPTGIAANHPYVIVTSSSTVATIAEVATPATPLTFTGGAVTATATQGLQINVANGAASMGLSATFSGTGTLSFLSSPDGLVWIARNYLTPATGVLSLTMTSTSDGKFNVGSSAYIVPYISTAVSSQTIAIAYDQSIASTLNALTSPLPPGTNAIGTVGVPTWAGGTLGAMANYGTSPSAVLVPGVNAFVTNTVTTATGAADPCQANAATILPFTIPTNTTTNVLTGTSNKKIYVCYLYMQTGLANNVAIIEGTTGGTCGSSTKAMVGGTTAATGLLNSANSGQAMGNGGYAVLQTTVNNNDICMITSASGPLAGVMKYVLQ